MHRSLLTIVVAGALLGWSQTAAAQGRAWEDRVFAGISFGVQSGTREFNESTSLPIYGEQATLSTSSRFESGGFFDIMGGARAWRNFGIAIGYTKLYDMDGDATADGSIPHPLFFDRPRTFSTPVNGLRRQEHATHLMFGWMVPVNDNFDVFAYAGPSFFRINQDVIDNVDVTEVGPPFTNVSVTPSVATRKESAGGFNIGFDATYILYRRDAMKLGVGGFFRYAGATANIDLAGSSAETDIGGAQFGVGARVRF